MGGSWRPPLCGCGDGHRPRRHFARPDFRSNFTHGTSTYPQTKTRLATRASSQKQLEGGGQPAFMSNPFFGELPSSAERTMSATLRKVCSLCDSRSKLFFENV